MEKSLIKDYIKYSAKENSSLVINSDNRKKVFNEIIALKLVEDFILDQDEHLITLDYEVPDKKPFEARKELFHLNYLKINDYYVAIAYTFNENEIFLPRKIINSTLSPDFYIFVLINHNENTFKLLGFVSSDSLLLNTEIINNELYKLDCTKIQEINLFVDIIEQNSLIKEYNFDSYELSNEKTSFLECIEKETLSLDFIDEISLLDSESYYNLLYSEDLSNKYLKLQNEHKNNNTLRESNLKKLFSFNKKIYRPNINSPYYSGNTFSAGLFGGLLLGLGNFISPVRVKNLNQGKVITKAVAGTKGKIIIKVLEMDLIQKTLKVSNITPKVNLDDEDKTLTISHLNEYNNKNWLLLISEDEKDINEVFKEWGEPDFIEKYKNDFYYGSEDKNDTINDGYLDINLNTELPLNITILLAVIM